MSTNGICRPGRKLILHIGTEKTGTTSIQHALIRDRAALAERGILHPVLFGYENHMELAVAAMSPGSADELQMTELGRHQITHAVYVDKLRAQLGAELAVQDYHTLLISSEHCHSRLRTPDAIANLIKILGVDPADVKIIVYLRRQDRLAVSVHSTRVKLGGSGTIFPATPIGNMPAYFMYNWLLDRYASVVGRDNIIVRLFERQTLIDDDVVKDFYHVSGVEMSPTTTPKVNISLSAAQLVFLERFNTHFPLLREGKINPERGQIYHAVKNTCRGTPYRPDRASAQRFYSAFAESNALVRHTYLPEADNETLFDDEFSEYPVVEEKAALSEDEMLAFVSAIWRFGMRAAKPPNG